MFDAQAHLIQLPRRVKDRQTGQYITVYDDYLEVKWRLVWFREKFPRGVIHTEEIWVDLERGYARYRAMVEDGEGGKATGYGTETAEGFADYVERAETRALGRALAALGLGTQFVGADLTEGEHVVDAPVASANRQPAVPPPETPRPDAGETPLPTTIPAEAGLPCEGKGLTTLTPAQLFMVTSKVQHRAEADAAHWGPLLEALQAEHAMRLLRGQRPPPAHGSRSQHGRRA
jgi:hypothetical protein